MWEEQEETGQEAEGEAAWEMPTPSTLRLRRHASLAHPEVQDEGNGCAIPVAVAAE